MKHRTHSTDLYCILLATVAVLCPVLPAAAQHTAPVAHWTFDEAPTGGDGPGVFGGALELRGAHSIPVACLALPELAALTLSVWVRPSELGGFREILRKECGHRLLFSFQESGTILSLGLDIGGYVECDAPLSPEQAVDGAWHHCAATFDGKTMRVFFDGLEIGAMERPGTVRLCPETPAFIGSTGGVNEHFQGGMDDLRVYDTALSTEEIAALFQQGVDAAAETAKALDAAAGEIYALQPGFAETLSAVRARLAERKGRADTGLAGAVLTRLRADFPEEYAAFADGTGLTPLEWLTDRHGNFPASHARRLLELLLEYKPLTEAQWAAQSPADLEKWAAADRVAERLAALEARGEEVRFSPEWVGLIREMAAGIQFRPRVSEAVAPYIKPETPETRTLDDNEARALLDGDWLFQADNDPSPERILREISRARELAAQSTLPEPKRGALLKQLDALESRAKRLKGPDRDRYLEARRIKRDFFLAHPEVDFSRVLLVDMPYPAGSEWNHETRHRLGYMAVPGGRLLILDGLHPGGAVTRLMPQPPLHGSFWRPDLSFDGEKVLFCFKPHNEKTFHLYEIKVDGTGLRQLTHGPSDDLDPIYLPDGHILFTTTRGLNYVRCMPPTNAFQLARADADGKNIYLVSASNEPDYLPSVMDDGRVVYTRWEYTDKPLWRAQKLWTTNPDGTQSLMYWGNQSVWPDVMKDARVIPGTRRVMFTGSAHHDWFAGSVGIVDPDHGLNFPHGLTKVTADVAWPECGNGPVDPVESPRYERAGDFTAYQSPHPLGSRTFLVSARRGGRDDKFRLYLMDLDGNRELLYEGARNVFHAMPLKPRPMPPVIFDRVAWPDRDHRENPAPAVLYSANVWQNAPPELEGRAKFLRILVIEPKTYTYWHKRPYISTGPVVSAVQSEGVKRVLGTVPVAPDGSVSFNAPPGQPLHFQILDENHRALQTMRSFVGMMPGERRGCLGCHESHSRAPVTAKAAALLDAPRDITPPPWPDTTVSWHRNVRPVLDRYCAECHEGDGEGRKVFDTTERPGDPSVFTEPYLTLIGRPAWGAPYTPPENPPPGFGLAGVLMVEAFGQTDPAAYVTPKPMTSLSYRSPLIERASSGAHHGVKVDDESLMRLIHWVDALCPYLGDEEVREIPDPDFQGIDWLPVRPRIKTAPVVARPGPLD